MVTSVFASPRQIRSSVKRAVLLAHRPALGLGEHRLCRSRRAGRRPSASAPRRRPPAARSRRRAARTARAGIVEVVASVQPGESPVEARSDADGAPACPRSARRGRRAATIGCRYGRWSGGACCVTSAVRPPARNTVMVPAAASCRDRRSPSRRPARAAPAACGSARNATRTATATTRTSVARIRERSDSLHGSTRCQGLQSATDFNTRARAEWPGSLSRVAVAGSRASRVRVARRTLHRTSARSTARRTCPHARTVPVAR